MKLVYISKLGFKICCVNVKTQKIDSFILEIFRIVMVNFQVEEKFEKAYFIYKTFLLIEINIKIVVKNLFSLSVM